MVRTLPTDVPRLDFQRVLAIGFAIGLHFLALLLLLLPLAGGPLPDAREERPVERWQVRQVPPAPPLPPQPVQQPKAAPLPARPTIPAPVATPVQPAIVDQGSLPAEPATGTGPVASDIAPASGPLQGATLRLDVAPPPPYPRDALRAGIEGRVLLRVLVDVDGRPLEVGVERSSGHRSLDREAVRQVKQRWCFQPAMRDGQAVQAWGLVPIDFGLQ